MKSRLVLRGMTLLMIVALLVPGKPPPMAAQSQPASPAAPALSPVLSSVEGEAEEPLPAPDRAPVAEAMHSAPVMFIKNVGQFPEEARFQVRGGPGTMWLAQDAIWITVFEQRRDAAEELKRDSPLHLRTSASPPRRGVNLKLSFPDANPHPRIEPFDQLDTMVSYLIGNDPDQWHPGVPVWGGVRYKDLYPDVDLEVTSEGGVWTWRLVVSDSRPAISDVRLRMEGANDLLLDDAGYLHLTTDVGVFTLPLLTVKGIAPDGRPATYNLERGIFEVTSPFSSAPLLPDTSAPALLSSQDNPDDLLYSTFLGGSNFDSGSDITVDGAGTAYVTGGTESYDFPTTPGAFETSLDSSSDAFVVKLNADGTGLTYATFLGGSDSDWGSAVAVDAAGSAYVTGNTYSSNFPTTASAFDTSYNGGYYDAFVAKVNASGTALAYATFLGGSSEDSGHGIAVDRVGSAYVTGDIKSYDFPTTAGAFDTSYNGGYYDAFVVKVNPSGTALAYATFLGGSQSDYGGAIAVDGGGSTYVMGGTWSSNFPTTAGAFDTSLDGYRDAFVVKLNPSGTALAYATFLGGSDSEISSAIAVDGAGSAHVTGLTESYDFPTTAGAFGTSYNGGYWDAFVVKVNASGAALAYATFLGGSDNDYSRAIAVDGAGSAYVTGDTKSYDFPTTVGAFDTSLDGYRDAFVVKLNPSGTALAYATFLGGSSEEGGSAIAVDRAGSAYAAGGTSSPDFPTTVTAFDTSHNGYVDAFVAKLATDTTPPAMQMVGTDPDNRQINRDLCPGVIVLELYAVASDPGGLDWVRLHYAIDGQPQPYVELDLDGQVAETFFYALGPFPQPATVHYHLKARDMAGNESSTNPHILTVSDCPGCTSWRVGFSPRADGFRFRNFSTRFWPGYCAGMSASAIDYSEYQTPIPSEYNHWVSPEGADPDNPLSCYIKRRHMVVNLYAIPYQMGQLISSPARLSRNLDEYYAIRSRIRDDDRVALVGLGITKGHSVSVYAVTECTDNRIALFAYDSNKVFRVGGAFAGAINGRLTEDGLVIDSTSTGCYKDIFADFTAPGLPLPQYPDLSSCDDSNIDQAGAEVATAGYLVDPRSMVESTLVPGESSPTYQFWNDVAVSSAVFASWPGGQLRLSVFHPDGSLFSEAEGNQSPLIVNIPAGQPDGTWSYQITRVDMLRGAESYPCISLVVYPRFDVYLPLILRSR